MSHRSEPWNSATRAGLIPTLALTMILFCSHPPLWAKPASGTKEPSPVRSIAPSPSRDPVAGSGTAETPIATATGSSPATSEVSLLDISQIKSDPFTLKTDGFQVAGQHLGKQVEVLEQKIASRTSPLLGSEIVWGITGLKAMITLLLLAILLVVDLGLRRLIDRQVRKYDLPNPTVESLSRAADLWLDPFLAALRPPLSLFLWGYGGVTIVSFLLSRVSTGDQLNWVNWTAGQLAELSGLIAFFWFLLRIITILDVRLQRWADTTSSPWDNLLVPFVARVLRFFLPFFGVIFALPILEISPVVIAWVQCLVTLTLIGAVAWILIELVLVIESGILAPYQTALGNVSDNLKARQIFTQVHILKKVLVTIIGILAIAFMLMVFEQVRQLGTSILASAGVLGIIVGFAAQRSISTLLAGIQIAVTQPIRIGDVVIVEGEWGWIEEITLTTVVVKIWDLRRLVLPIGYFIEKPFQNWTRTSSKMLGSIFFHVDYRFPVEALREPLQRIVEASPLWDRDVCGLQVTNTNERGVELRALVSAEDSSKAWDLRCEVREKVLAWLQEHHPGSLPRVRVEFSPPPREQPGESMGLGSETTTADAGPMSARGRNGPPTLGSR